MNCKLCKYFRDHEQIKNVGYCHVNPPVVQFLPMMRQEMNLKTRQLVDVPGMSPASALPITQANSMCRLWENKQQAN